MKMDEAEGLHEFIFEFANLMEAGVPGEIDYNEYLAVTAAFELLFEAEEEGGDDTGDYSGVDRLNMQKKADANACATQTAFPDASNYNFNNGHCFLFETDTCKNGSNAANEGNCVDHTAGNTCPTAQQCAELLGSATPLMQKKTQEATAGISELDDAL